MENQTGKGLSIVGKVVIGLGVVGSFIIWGCFDFETIGFFWSLAAFVSTFLLGMLFIGFSEVIFLLQENLNANKVTSVQTRVEKNVETDELPEI